VTGCARRARWVPIQRNCETATLQENLRLLLMLLIKMTLKLIRLLLLIAVYLV
jgi:hypothetical protein